MDKRDVKTLAGTASHFLNVAKVQEFEDGRFIEDLNTYLNKYESKLKTKAFATESDMIKVDILRRMVTDAKMHLKRVNKNIRRNLEKAYVLAEEKVKSGRSTPSDLLEVHGLLDTFSRLNLFMERTKVSFGLKSKSFYLNEMVNKAREKGFDEELIEIIKLRISNLMMVFESKRSNMIEISADNIERKLRARFKLKRKLISLNRHYGDFIVNNGHNRVHIDIFFDKNLNQNTVKKILEGHINALECSIELMHKRDNDPRLGRLLLSIQAKRYKIEKMGLDAFENEIISRLKDVMVNVFKNNKNLIATPSLRCQLKISDIPRMIAACSGFSRIDHYLLEIDINFLIIGYLIGENYYSPIDEIQYQWVSNAARKENLVAYKGHIIARTDEFDNLGKRIQIMRYNLERYRSNSIYSAIVHEITHAWDNGNSIKYYNLMKEVNLIAYKAELYKTKTSINAGREMIILLNFYSTCRIESISQIGEWIGNYQASIKVNEGIGAIQMKMFHTKELIRALNRVIDYLVNSDEEKSMGHMERFQGEYGYSFGYLFSLTMFLAYCKTHDRKLLIIDEKAFKKLHSKYPKVAEALTYSHNIKNINESDREYFMARSMKDIDSFRQMLTKEGIKVRGTQDAADLINEGIKFYIFSPPIDILQGIMNRIKATDEVSFLDTYERACDVLGINDRAFSIRKIKVFAERVNTAKSIMQEKAGFHRV